MGILPYKSLIRFTFVLSIKGIVILLLLLLIIGLIIVLLIRRISIASISLLFVFDEVLRLVLWNIISNNVITNTIVLVDNDVMIIIPQLLVLPALDNINICTNVETIA